MDKSRYNFNNVNDLNRFITLIIDGYPPTQLEKLDSDLVEDAIDWLKENKIELSGNGIFSEAVNIALHNVDEKINEIKEYSEYKDWDLTEKENKILEDFLKSYTESSDIIDYYANGNLDSSVYVKCDLSDYELAAMKIINEYTDIFSNLSEQIDLSIDKILNIDIDSIDIEEEEIL